MADFSDAIIHSPNPNDYPDFTPPGEVNYNDKVILFMNYSEDFATDVENSRHIDDDSILETLNRYASSNMSQNFDGGGSYRFTNMKNPTDIGISKDYTTKWQMNDEYGGTLPDITDTNFNGPFTDTYNEVIIDDIEWELNTDLDDFSHVGTFILTPTTPGKIGDYYFLSNYNDKNSFNKTYHLAGSASFDRIIDFEHPGTTNVDVPIHGDRIRLIITNPTVRQGFRASTTGINGFVDDILFDKTYRIAILDFVFTTSGWLIKNSILGET